MIITKTFTKILNVLSAAVLAASVILTPATASAKPKKTGNPLLNRTHASLYQGKTVRLTSRDKVIWSSDNQSVAYITKATSKRAIIRGIRGGSAVVTAKSPTGKSTCKITVRDVPSGTVIYNLSQETGTDPVSGESLAPPVVRKYDVFKYNSYAIWACRAILYDPLYKTPDYRGRKLNITLTLQNSGNRNLPELGVCFNYTGGSRDGSYPWALHVSENELENKTKKSNTHLNCKIVKQAIQKGQTCTWKFSYTIPKNAKNIVTDEDNDTEYPITMYIPNCRKNSPYRSGDVLTIRKCLIETA